MDQPARDPQTRVVRYLREAVLGAIDGTVTTFAIVAGVAGAGLPMGVVLALGTANVVADGFSMAAGVYAGGRAERENAARRRAACARMIDERPDAARAALKAHLAAAGLRDAALETATAAVATSHAAWTAMLADGDGAATGAPLGEATAVFAAFVACGLVPLLPFALGLDDPFAVSVGATLATFAAIGALRARWSLRSWWASAVETVAIGGAAAILAFAVGRLFDA